MQPRQRVAAASRRLRQVATLTFWKELARSVRVRTCAIVLIAIGLEVFLVMQLMDAKWLRGRSGAQASPFLQGAAVVSCVSAVLLTIMFRVKLRISRNAEPPAPPAPLEPKTLSGEQLESALSPWSEVCSAENWEGSEECGERIEDCPICLDSIDASDLVRGLRGCGHAFHKDCIDGWLATQPVSRHACPLCRQRLLVPATLHESELFVLV